jgi:hypothetical protein
MAPTLLRVTFRPDAVRADLTRVRLESPTYAARSERAPGRDPEIWTERTSRSCPGLNPGAPTELDAGERTQ